MDLTVHIPDDIAGRIGADGSDLSRRALEALAVEEYKSGRLSDPELSRLLGFATRYQLDGFLKSHGIFEDYTLEDFDRERQALKDLGL
jgi:predicted HTH domain antitoxin